MDVITSTEQAGVIVCGICTSDRWSETILWPVGNFSYSASLFVPDTCSSVCSVVPQSSALANSTKQAFWLMGECPLYYLGLCISATH